MNVLIYQNKERKAYKWDGQGGGRWSRVGERQRPLHTNHPGPYFPLLPRRKNINTEQLVISDEHVMLVQWDLKRGETAKK